MIIKPEIEAKVKLLSLIPGEEESTDRIKSFAIREGHRQMVAGNSLGIFIKFNVM